MTATGSATPRQVPGWLRRLLSEARFGWVDARLMVTLPGTDRALRFVAVLLFGQRASYVLPAVVNVADGGHRYLSPAVNVALLTTLIAWNVALVVAVWRRGWFTRRMMVADVVVACVMLYAVNLNLGPGSELSGANWAEKFALGTAALVGAASGFWVLLSLIAVVVAVAAIAVGVQIGGMPLMDADFRSFANSSLWFAILFYFMRRFLCAQAGAVDEATARRVTVETARAADQARFTERLNHYRTLHDTVLATLTAIARGGLDHASDRVRERCATDADYIRQLLAADSAESFTTFGNRLAEVAADATNFGLRVHLYHGAAPAHLPRHVVDTVCDASREALNNVARHAGVDQAWLSTEWSDERLAVRVVDRGVGFNPQAVTHGFGLSRSIAERMREIGGEHQIFSMPGEGTSVELFWTRPRRQAP